MINLDKLIQKIDGTYWHTITINIVINSIILHEKMSLTYIPSIKNSHDKPIMNSTDIVYVYLRYVLYYRPFNTLKFPV